jgi:putative oxidoreductase
MELVNYTTYVAYTTDVYYQTTQGESRMSIALWIAQILLAGMYGMTGSLKTFQAAKVRDNPQMTWAKGRSDGYIRFIGVSELLGAFGLTLPILTGVLQWLTPVAAIGLSVIQLLAIFQEHLPKKEYNVLPSIWFYSRFQCLRPWVARIYSLNKGEIK